MHTYEMIHISLYLNSLILDRLHAIPANDSHAQEGRQTAEHERHNASRREACRQWSGRFILALQVQVILRVTSSVTRRGDFARFTGLQVVLWNLAAQLLLDGERGFDHGCDESRRYVPFNVAVEEPHARVIGAETEHKVAVWTH